MTENIEKLTKQKSEKHGTKSRIKNSKEKVKPLAKVIIRRLPPTMTEEEFLKHVDPMPDHEFYYYVPADWSLGFDATCRAYITFKKQEDLFLFKERFDGYVFVDNKGSEYPAVVEFAAFQSLPKNRSRKIDSKANSIESDPHYITFLEKLNSDTEVKNELKLEFTLQTNKENKITSTPLLQYLANKKQERRDDRKKKMEDKKRQRDEERQNKKITIVQKPAVILKDDESNKGGNKFKDREKPGDSRRDRGGGGGGDRTGGDKNERTGDRKDSRAKRRAERDMKRREERDIRDKERATRDRERNSQEKKTADVKPATNLNTQERQSSKNTEQKSIIIKEDDLKRKDVKRYSQSRRDKARAKNEASQNSEVVSLKKSVVPAVSTGAIPKHSSAAPVKDYINSVANIREFIPRNRNNSIETATDQPINLKEVNQILKDISGNDKLKNVSQEKLEGTSSSMDGNDPENSQQINTSRRGSRSSSSANEKGAFGYMDKKDSRRIRNKDRPSIAIYQPGKLRLGGTSSSEALKDKSNPPSDTENSSKHLETQQPNVKKKFTRYSERRANRFGNRSKEIPNKHVDGKYQLVIPETEPNEVGAPIEKLTTRKDSKSDKQLQTDSVRLVDEKLNALRNESKISDSSAGSSKLLSKEFDKMELA